MLLINRLMQFRKRGSLASFPSLHFYFTLGRSAKTSFVHSWSMEPSSRKLLDSFADVQMTWSAYIDGILRES